MLARGTPPQLESNAKMSVKPHNIYLFPRLPDFFFLLEEGKGGGGVVGTTRQTQYQGLYFSLLGVVMIQRVESFITPI